MDSDLVEVFKADVSVFLSTAATAQRRRRRKGCIFQWVGQIILTKAIVSKMPKKGDRECAVCMWMCRDSHAATIHEVPSRT